MATLLFLTPQPPFPPRQGTAIRNWGLLSGLARNHQVDLLTFTEDAGGRVHVVLRALCRRVATVAMPQRSMGARLGTLLRSSQPDLALRLHSDAFAARLRELLRDDAPDVVHIEGLELAGYLPIIRKAAPNARVIYDAHNAETVIQQRAFRTDVRRPRRWPAAFYSWVQAARLASYEREVVQSVEHVLCVSAEDAAVLRELAGVEPLIVPNGLSLIDYQGILPAQLGDETGDRVLVFTGKMDYRPNVDAVRWFAAQIFPRIRAQHAQAQFVIVGQRPTAAVQALAAQPGIAVTGAVAEVQPYVAAASVYVAPLRMGGGTRFKLLEAMALHRAIVSTTIGAEGFAVQAGRELLLADEPAAFAEAVLSLMADPPRRAAMGAAGRAFVAAGYDWLTIVPTVEALY